MEFVGEIGLKPVKKIAEKVQDGLHTDVEFGTIFLQVYAVAQLKHCRVQSVSVALDLVELLCVVIV